MRLRLLVCTCLLFISFSLIPGELSADTLPPRILEYFPRVVASTPGPASSEVEPPSRFVQIDIGLFQSDPEAVTLMLPNGREVTVHRSHWDWQSFDTFTWSGEVGGDPGLETLGAGGSLSLYSIEGRVYGDLRAPDGEFYRLIPSGEQHDLVRETPARGATCGVRHTPATSGTGADSLENLVAPLTGVTDQDCATVPGTFTRIDVMVLYPRSLAGSAQAVADYAAQQVFKANRIFALSFAKVEYRLVHVGPITGPQPPEPLAFSSDPDFPEATGPVLQWLNDQFATESPPQDTEVELLRKAYGADMISVVIPPHPNVNCGLANEPFLSGTTEMAGKAPNTFPFGNRAFTVVELDCDNANFTFAHELGHNWGLRHHDRRNAVTNIYPWSYGYIVPLQTGGPRATLMACVAGSGGCKRIERVSNPDVTWSGLPTGLHSSQSADPAHSACVVNLRASTYEDFAHPPSSAPPSLLITNPVDGTSVAAGANLYVSANATDPEDGDLRSAVQWSSDRDGDLGSGSPRLVTLSSGGRHLITATVSDSNQTKIQTSVLVDALESDVPRMFVDRPGHLEVVSGVIPIQGWATDASGVEDISFKLDGLAVNVANFTYGTYRLGACDANADLNDPNCPFVGFQGNLDTSPFSNGLHTLSVTARDHFGNAVTFNRRFETQNQATLSFAPTADAWISEAQPNSNFGGDTSLQLRASGSGDARHTYLKFQVSGVLRPVQNATLQLRYASDSFRTIRIYWIKSSKWTESGITWLKAPTDFYLQYPVALPLPLPGNNRFELDVSRIISGDGTYTIGLVAQDLPDQAIFSRETGLAAPNLEVTF